MAECPPEFRDYCTKKKGDCPLYVAGDCMYDMAKYHRDEESHHRRLAQKYEAEIRRVVLSYAVKPEEAVK